VVCFVPSVVFSRGGENRVYCVRFGIGLSVTEEHRTNNGALTGRVEHIASGDAVLFWDQHELFNFFGRILGVSRRARPRTGKD